MTASSSTDVWAVASVAQRALVEHWDGHSWTAQPTPAPGIESSLQDISAASADDVWAVGQWQSAGHPNVIDPLILHWDGTSWLQVAVAGEKSRYNTLYSVSADSAVDAWAIGSAGTRGHRLLRHWDGSSWL